MALRNDALTTPDRLAAYMEIATPTGVQLTAMQALINSLSSYIENYTSRKFMAQVYNKLEVDTERGQNIFLPYLPVVSSAGFTLERRSSQLNEDKWQTIDGTYYEVDYTNGIIRMMDGVYVFRGRRLYRVTFTAGYQFDNVSTFLADTEAGDIEVALWIMAKDAWLLKKVPTNVYQERLGDYSITFQRAVKGSSGYFTDNQQACAILEKYIEPSPVGVLTPLQSIGN